MVIKRRQKPLPLQMLDALMSRLPSNHSQIKVMQKDAAIRQKGYIGEQQVDYHLEKLTQQKTILQDVCLFIHNRRVQIDTVIIGKYGLYCVEVKNYEGTIIFNTVLRQFIRDDGKEEAGFRNPISQVEQQNMFMRMWLREKKFYNVPVHHFIAISEPSTIIKVEGDEQAIANIVAHAEHIPKMIQEKEQQLKQSGRAPLPVNALSEAILKACQPYYINVLRQYGIRKRDILLGVHCPKCERLRMRRQRRSWYCPFCKQTSKTAHMKAFSDYFLLMDAWITNKQAMQFLQVSSRHVVTRLFKKSNLIYHPKYRAWTKR